VNKVESITQQIEAVYWHLDEIYQNTDTLVQSPLELVPVILKNLGIASEEIQVALEELWQQNQELADAQAEAQTQRQRYQELFKLAPYGYLVTDAAGIIQEANRAAATLLNVSQGFLVNKSLLFFVAEDERQMFRSWLLKLRQAKQGQDWIVRFSPPKSEPFEGALAIAPVCNGEGKPSRLHVCIRKLSHAERSSLCLPKQVELKPEGNDNTPSQEQPTHFYSKGELIPLEPQTIWQVCQGIVKLSTICENGEEVVLGLAGPSMAFGADLTSLKIYQAAALSKVQLVHFSLSDIAASPELAQRLLPQINQRLQQTETFLAIFGQRRVKDRFHQLLQLLKQEFGQTVEQGTRLEVRLTHQDLANICSTTRVTITRLLGDLQAKGRITLDSKHRIIFPKLTSTPTGRSSTFWD